MTDHQRRYHDVFGEQESVGAVFDYNNRDHAMMVLIDHSLGGGVKDGWLAAGRRARCLRDRMASQMTTHPDLRGRGCLPPPHPEPRRSPSGASGLAGARGRLLVPLGP